MNLPKTSQHFKLEREKRQRDPVSAYLFIDEIVFLSLNYNKDFKSIELFQGKLLYKRYTDNTTFFLKMKNQYLY